MLTDPNHTIRLGALISLATISLCVLIFVFRLAGKPEIERWLGVIFIAMAIPYAYLLITARAHEQAPIYYIQLIAILLFIVIELLLDYILKVDFRRVKWMTILYVIFFFAGTGGLIGIASQAGRTWSLVAIVLFLVMSMLAFWQRAKTGM
jgi:hypothetical protein